MSGLHLLALYSNKYNFSSRLRVKKHKHTYIAWKNSVDAAVGGLGLLIGPRALKTLNSIEKIQPKMMAATFNGNFRAKIIS